MCAGTFVGIPSLNFLDRKSTTVCELFPSFKDDRYKHKMKRIRYDNERLNKSIDKKIALSCQLVIYESQLDFHFTNEVHIKNLLFSLSYVLYFFAKYTI